MAIDTNPIKSRKDTFRTLGKNFGSEYEIIAGKKQPNSIELEEYILGAVMIEKEALAIVTELIKPENLYSPVHQLIYNSILKLYSNSQPVDIGTVQNQLKKDGRFEEVGGSYYLIKLTTNISSAANVEAYSRTILEKSIQRELIRISTEITTEAYQESTDVFELLDKAEKGIFSVSEGHLRKNYDRMGSLIKKALEQIDHARKHDDFQLGVKTGFKEIDDLTSGLQPSNLIILAARPGMGKTSFVLNIARNVAVDSKKAVAIFSLEMSSLELVTRLISSEARIESDKLRKGTLTEKNFIDLQENLKLLDTAQIFIDDTPQLSTFELRSKCRRLKANNNIELIIIDYLQLMQSSNDHKGNREQEIGAISRALKSLAKELEVPVIALSQLNRAVETRSGNQNKPKLSDLRESGSIEQDADIVAFIYRPEIYGVQEDAEGNDIRGIAEIIIEKHRNGPIGFSRLKFDSRYTRFDNIENLVIYQSNINSNTNTNTNNNNTNPPDFDIDLSENNTPF